MLGIEVCPYSYFQWYGHSQQSLSVTFYEKWVLNKGHKNYFKDRSLIDSQLTFQILP